MYYYYSPTCLILPLTTIRVYCNKNTINIPIIVQKYMITTNVIFCSTLYYHKISNYACIWNRVLLAKLTGSQLVKKFHAFYGTWRFIFAFTSAHHLSLSWARSIQSMPPHPTSAVLSEPDLCTYRLLTFHVHFKLQYH